jgi:uncharacterized protein (TIGR03086 family)
MADGSEHYRLIAGGFDARVNAVVGGDWNAPSPCSEWKARDVVGHVVGNHRWLAAGVRGGETQPMADDEDPSEAWRNAYSAVLELTEDPVAMATKVEGPLGDMPFAEMLASFVCMDLLVHTWDLARAVGGDERLDEVSVSRAFETMKPLDDQIRQPGFFGPKVGPPAGADTQTEFLYFLGRQA